jgi:hypothetical protein
MVQRMNEIIDYELLHRAKEIQKQHFRKSVVDHPIIGDLSSLKRREYLAK